MVEGVMFGGKYHYVTAIRRKDQSVEYFHVPRKTHPFVASLKKIPFVRGIAAIIEASANGSKHLNFSTERFDIDPKDDAMIEEQETSRLAMYLGVAAVGVISFLFGKFLFTLIPAFLAHLTIDIFPGRTVQVLIEGLIKLILLLAYIYIVSLTPIVKRVFQYHGAEHKVINCFESGDELTVENVQKSSRLHYRCGSSFILFTVIVGVFVYLLFPIDSLWLRLLSRVALIPVVLGISFEVLQLTNKLRDVPVLRWLGLPGLWLQLLTTKEPDNSQAEIAILSFKELLKMEKNSEEQTDSEEIV
ncbi:YqhQ protein [Bacillus sp. B-jedd]|nr:YqhQ protein [Bacillus sp. B-jedd]